MIAFQLLRYRLVLLTLEILLACGWVLGKSLPFGVWLLCIVYLLWISLSVRRRQVFRSISGRFGSSWNRSALFTTGSVVVILGSSSIGLRLALGQSGNGILHRPEWSGLVPFASVAIHAGAAILLFLFWQPNWAPLRTTRNLAFGALLSGTLTNTAENVLGGGVFNYFRMKGAYGWLCPGCYLAFPDGYLANLGDICVHVGGAIFLALTVGWICSCRPASPCVQAEIKEAPQ